MSTGPRFEVWLESLAGTTTESAEQALSRAFGIPLESAREMVAALPRVVKRDADAGLAARIVAALEAIGGRAQSRPAPGPGLAAANLPAARNGGPPSTASTLKLGTQDLHLLLPSTWSRPVAAPAPVHAHAPAHAVDFAHAPTALPMPAPSIAPATTRADALQLAVEPLHPVEARKRAPERVSLLAPELFGGHPTPSVTPARVSPAPHSPPHALEVGPDLGPALEVAAPEGWKHPLQLPTPDPSGRSTVRMRPPTERSPDPQRRSVPPAVRARPRPPPPSLLQPLKLVLSIWEEAERSSWSNALRNHSVVGFLLVLGGISGTFLLLIAAL